MILILLAAQGMTFTNTKPAAPVEVRSAQPPSTVVNAVPVVRVVSPPQPRAPAQSYFSPDDYPAAAVGTGAKGRVTVMLGLNVQGRVTSCNVLRSSGSSALDMATCNILHRRAGFTPAMDSNGNPVASYIGQTVEWSAP
jgi:periplasmic protein TonB